MEASEKFTKLKRECFNYLSGLEININDQRKAEKRELILQFKNSILLPDEYKILYDLKQNKIIAQKFGSTLLSNQKHNNGDKLQYLKFLLQNIEPDNAEYLLELLLANLKFLQTLSADDITEYGINYQYSIITPTNKCKCHVNTGQVKLLDALNKPWIILLSCLPMQLPEQKYDERKKIFSIYPIRHKKAFKLFWNGEITYLTPMEIETLLMIKNGLSISNAANNLNVSNHTVIKHSNNIYSKLCVKNSKAAIKFAFIMNFISNKFL